MIPLIKRPVFLLFFISFVSFQRPHAQNNGLPYWDYRSNSILLSTLGVGYQFDADNNGFYAFVDIEYSPTRDLYKNYKGVDKLYGWYLNVPVKFGFKLGRDFERYQVLSGNDKDEKGNRKYPTGWSYNIRFDIIAEGIFNKIDPVYEETQNWVEGTVWSVGYCFHNSYFTDQLRKLSNTNGRITVGFRNIADRWNTQLYLQNDFWIFFLKDDIVKHDHGNTTEYGFYSHYRPREEDLFYRDTWFGPENKFYFNWWLEIITGRKVANTSSMAFARLGYYSIDTTNAIFHTYSRYTLGYQNSFMDLKTGFMYDNPVRGRNLQRWGHQGRNHRNLKSRSRPLGFLEKKQLFISEFDFTRNNKEGRRGFLRYAYLNGYVDELREALQVPDIIQVKTHIEKMNDDDIKKLYEGNYALKFLFERQLYVNKHRYKKSRTFETTPLFPWERDEAFYRKPSRSLFYDLTFFRRTFK